MIYASYQDPHIILIELLKRFFALFGSKERKLTSNGFLDSQSEEETHSVNLDVHYS